MKNYPKEVIEIHNEFNTAGEKLLTNALEIINKCGMSTIEKAERLKKVGFTQADDVKKAETIKDPKSLAELVNHYNMSYPNNKFITEDKVKAICEKYKLLCAPISRYKGFVPETKLQQIEKFYLKEGDKNGLTCTNVIFRFTSSDEIAIKNLKKKYPNNIFPISDSDAKSRFPAIERVDIQKIDLIDNNALLICAPKKDMDLKGLKKLGAIFQSLTTVTVPDPVVLQPVKGGFLILAAWGDEASDELVVNNKFN